MSFYSIAPYIEKNYPQYYSIETYPVSQCVAIHKIDEEWGIFSNFARTPILVEGVEFKNTEQLFQIMKFKEKEPVEAVYHAGNPKMTTKHWEKTHRRADWGEMLVDAMKYCLQQKYEQSPAFKQKIEESKGKFIVENQTTFPQKTANTWGVKRIGDNFVGPNLLGRLLMELRDNGKLEYKLPKDAFAFLQWLSKK